VSGSIGISPDVAVLLERALTPRPDLDRAEADYQAHVSREKRKPNFQEFSQWAAKFDPDTLQRHEITGPQDDPATKAEKVSGSSGGQSRSVRAYLATAQGVFRRSRPSCNGAEHGTMLRLVERNAQHLDVPPLRDATLRKTHGPFRRYHAHHSRWLYRGPRRARRGRRRLAFVREIRERGCAGAPGGWQLTGPSSG